MWKRSKEKKGYNFETDALKGYFEIEGAYRGIQSLMHKDENLEWVGDFGSGYPSYDIPPGVRLYLLSLYHYLGKNIPHGVLGRNMDSKVELIGETLQFVLSPVSGCNTTTVARFTFTAPEILDVELSVTAHAKLEDLEVCLSSYTVSRKWGTPFIYLSQQPANEGKGIFVQPQDTPFCAGWYHSNPRDNRSAALNYDGRWPGEPYQLHITGPYFRLPLMVSRNPKTGFTLVQMADYENCVRLGSLYSSDDLRIHVAFNKDFIPYSDSNLWADYSPTYFYFFGENFEPGQTRTARYRMILTKISQDLNETLDMYDEFKKKCDVERRKK